MVVASSAVQLTGKPRIRKADTRNQSVAMIEAATGQSDLSHFTKATLVSPSHTSHSDPKPHVTALLATDQQAADNRAQTVHIYHDENKKYTSHQLFDEETVTSG